LSPNGRIEWPGGKDFAFTVFDDTDLATLESLAPVYDLLHQLGLFTTKSVWPLKGATLTRFGGATCEDPEYLAWTLDLQAQGFEIGYHGASYTTSVRGRVIDAIERFRAIYGHDPLSMSNHIGCAESIYWGADRVSGGNRLLYNVLTGFSRNGAFTGHRQGDPHFWGDVCQTRIKYMRNFTFSDIDTLAACPIMPYHDPERPYVGLWFASTEGADVNAFNKRLSEANQDRLEAQGGACIMYTHLASGFSSNGKVNPRFKALMERLVRKNGWFVSVATLLDYLGTYQGENIVTAAQRRDLERRWMLSKLRVGST
jgi:hypothetical protein